MASISTRVSEANKFLENGHRFLKTSLLKWNPDHDNAANQFNQAAMAFRGAGLHKKAIEAYDLAIKSYLASSSSPFQAAKCMEQAALASKEIDDHQLASRYFLRAVDIFRTQGQLETAISTLDRGAKSVGEKLPTMAADMYIQASELATIEDRYRQAAEFCNKAANLYVKAKEYQRAANIIREEINCYAQVGDNRAMNRSSMNLILVSMAEDNIVAAMDVLKTCQIDSDIYPLAQSLVTGYDKKDARLLNSTLNHSFFKMLDTEYSKIARDLQRTYSKMIEETSANAAVAADPSTYQGEDENCLL